MITGARSLEGIALSQKERDSDRIVRNSRLASSLELEYEGQGWRRESEKRRLDDGQAVYSCRFPCVYVYITAIPCCIISTKKILDILNPLESLLLVAHHP